jgi:poly(A) polymerase
VGQSGEDATRRDFTINALYYDPTTTILDYHDGVRTCIGACCA